MLQSLVHIHRPNLAALSSILAIKLKSLELPHDHGVDIIKLSALAKSASFFLGLSLSPYLTYLGNGEPPAINKTVRDTTYTHHTH